MSRSFDPAGRSVLVEVRLVGPVRTAELVFALDTGATVTTVRSLYLSRIGYDLSVPTRRARLRSVTGGAAGGLFTVSALSAVGRTRTDFPVVAHDLPAAVTVDGLLGLDFFRGLVLTLDFDRGLLDLRPPGRRWWQLRR